MTSFKTGDKIEHKQGTSFSITDNLKGILEVEKYFPETSYNPAYVSLVGKGGIKWFAHRFQLIQPMAQEIKAGDTVRYMVNSYTSIDKGDKHIVKQTRMPITNSLELLLEGDNVWRSAKNFEKVETRKLVGYKLKKDLPDLKAGAVYTKTSERLTYPWSCPVPGGKASIYSQEDIEKTDWFEPVYEKPSQELILATGKRVWIDFTKKEVRLVNGTAGESISFEEVKRVVSVMQSGISSTRFAIAISQIKYGCVYITLDEAVNLSILIS